MSVPLRGQGTRLPSGFPYQGEWILEPRMFLFVPDQTRLNALAPQFTPHVGPTEDDWSFGFNATQLAAALGITVAELLEANRTRRLALEQVEADTPDGEGATAKRYTFSVGDRVGSLTIAAPMHFGIA